MVESRINKLIQYKLSAANTIINYMPPNMAMKLRELGMVILESVNENIQDKKEQSSSNTEASKHMSHISIE